MKKPEALRLADELEAPVGTQSTYSAMHQAAAELRRLHADNERLAAEVANRNRRALAGDEAVSALANVYAYYEKLEAQRDALLEAMRIAEAALSDIGDAALAQEQAGQEQVTYSTGALHLEAGFYSAVDLREMLKALDSMNAAARSAMEETK